MAEDLSCEENDYRSDCADSVGSSKSESEVSLSCEFSSFELGWQLWIRCQWTVPPLNRNQYKPLGSHSSGGIDSSGGSADEESAGAERLLNTEW